MTTPRPRTPLHPDARIVIIGAGHAGHHAAASLRTHHHQGPITLIGEEPTPPYERPPLSKTYLTGTLQDTDLWLRPPTYYTRHHITHLHATATHIDRPNRTIHLHNGTTHPYDHLILATGATPTTPPIPGTHLHGIHTLRTLQHAKNLRTHLNHATHIIVIGAGLIGLEFAATANQQGHHVTILETNHRALHRITSTPTADHLTHLHHHHGNHLLFNQTITNLHSNNNGHVTHVQLATGHQLPADLVLLATGATPNTHLATTSGLPTTRNGILTDHHLHTPDPHISAIGDCNTHPHPHTHNPTHTHTIQNATDQAHHLTQHLTQGTTHPYHQQPRTWTTQYTTTLQTTGHTPPTNPNPQHTNQDTTRDVILTTTPTSFSVLRYHNNQLTTVESINHPTNHTTAHHLLTTNNTPTHQQATTPGYTLQQHTHTTTTTTDTNTNTDPAAAMANATTTATTTT